MNELDLVLEELANLDNPAQETVIDRHLQSYASVHCDLFETNFYRDFWHSFHETDNTLISSTLEQLVNNLRP
ncbi:MAG: hypothetical protein PWR01_2540 [Clostridiales bacterium]|jgi:hypothetical protein|nr:hypothetical protein [Clostridiales bacterium]MDN5281467.1 hypothetical protein [Candidatus Ozemobacter sp.]